MPGPDEKIQNLLDDVQREAEELRRQRGASTVPPLQPPQTALESLERHTHSKDDSEAQRFYSYTLKKLRENVNPSDVDLKSHRGQIGRVVVFAKKILRQLLTPVWDRQVAFHEATIDALEQLDRKLNDGLLDRLAALEGRLSILEKLSAVRELGAGTAPFDYKKFEDAFRGDREHVAKNQSRYLEHFPDAAAGPVLDLGCGRGEFLELLAARGVPARGVELERGYVKDALGRGLDVREDDLTLALRDTEDHSLGGVVSFQVFEHLPLDKICQVLELAHQKLRPGGILIVETVNVASLITHTRSFVLDPTHEIALHPFTLRLLTEQRGFQDVQLAYSGEVESDTALKLEGLEPALARNFELLNEILFAPQDYAVVARA